MGGSGKGGGGTSASQTQSQLAQQLFAQTGPLRDLLFGSPGTAAVAATPGRFIGGGDSDGTFLPGLAGSPAVPGSPGMLQNLLTNPPNVPFERDVLESQFGRARGSSRLADLGKRDRALRRQGRRVSSHRPRCSVVSERALVS